MIHMKMYKLLDRDALCCRAVAAHTFNPHTKEAEAGESLVPRQGNDTLSQKQANKLNNNNRKP